MSYVKLEMVSKIWYQPGYNHSKHKHLGADILINAVFSKSKFAIKKNENLENHLLHEVPIT